MTDLIPTPLDRRAVRQAFDRAAGSHDDTAGLQRDVGDELLDRLDAVRVAPGRVIDLGCGTGVITRALRKRYRGAEVIGLDIAEGMLARMRGRGLFGRRPVAVCADMLRLPLPDASVDVAVSNLAFQWIDDLQALFGELRRILRPDGILLFSTFGPDTLYELRSAWAQVDDGVHVSEFVDMHDLGDQMVAAGLRDPVMDVDRIRRSYADLPDLLRRVKAVSAGNVALHRPRGLTGRGRLQALSRHYAHTDESGRPVASWEVVYGHAWGAATARGGQGDASHYAIPVEAIGRRKSGGSS